MRDILADGAEAVIAAVRKKATEIGALSNIAVVDSGANLKAFLRMDDALLGSLDVSIRKARTAALFGLATETLGELAQPGAPLYGIDSTNGGLILFGGGAPIVNAEGAVIGGVGVSGSTVENDTMLSAVGAAAANG
ncbi:MAG: heme-binding protein [Dehalococcoidia bacterium]|nr:heme-binding protein [Dehalococcoidia bacterium]